MKQIKMRIDGMRCGMCEAHVNDTIRKVGGIKKVKSSHKKGEVIIILEDASRLEEIKDAITKQGYKILNYDIFDSEK